MLANLPLSEKARLKWGRKCPCCMRTMERLDPKTRGRHTKLTMTKAHDRPQARGGRLWIFACYQCNQQQASRTFLQWAHVLVHYGDPRAPHVVEVAKFFAEEVR